MPMMASSTGSDATGTIATGGASDDETGDDDLNPGEIKLSITTSAVGARSYRVDVSDDEGKTWNTVHRATLPIAKEEYEHQNLKPEQALHFRLFGKEGSVVGLASNRGARLRRQHGLAGQGGKTCWRPRTEPARSMCRGRPPTTMAVPRLSNTASWSIRSMNKMT